MLAMITVTGMIKGSVLTMATKAMMKLRITMEEEYKYVQPDIF